MIGELFKFFKVFFGCFFFSEFVKDFLYFFGVYVVEGVFIVGFFDCEVEEEFGDVNYIGVFVYNYYFVVFYYCFCCIYVFVVNGSVEEFFWYVVVGRFVELNSFNFFICFCFVVYFVEYFFKCDFYWNFNVVVVFYFV